MTTFQKNETILVLIILIFFIRQPLHNNKFLNLDQQKRNEVRKKFMKVKIIQSWLEFNVYLDYISYCYEVVLLIILLFLLRSNLIIPRIIYNC